MKPYSRKDIISMDTSPYNMEFLCRNCGLCGVSSSPSLRAMDGFLIQCVGSECEKSYATRLFTLYPEYLRDAAVRAEELGLDPNSRMFRRGLAVVASIKKETVASKIRLLEELGFSQDDTLSIIRKSPNLLALTEGKIRQAMELFKREIGLEERYIAQRPVLFLYGLERRLLPRYCLLNVLRAKGLMVKKSDYYNTASMAERKFVQRFVDPYKDLIPGLADAYASSCSGKAKNGFASLLAV
uniref:Uncharacterized protein n=1 Tax=Leersia perrieri TaxID=77586 RepID=A0A0D9WNI1_9ORYZ